jgi:Cellulase (glycosyl hydrolase family 5)
VRAILRPYIWVVFAVVTMFAGAANARPWALTVDERNGLPAVTVGGAPAVASDFVFWERNWAWAQMIGLFRIRGPFEYTFTGKNPALDFSLDVNVRRLSGTQVVFEFDLSAHRASPDAIGGGLSFKFDLANAGAQLGEPELLAGNSGWAWGRRDGTRIEMRFDPPMASVFFERGAKSEIRAFFYRGEVPQGRKRHVATVTLSSDFTIAPAITERYGSDNASSWPTGLLFDWSIAPWNISPVDLSFLNAAERPAGKRGFVRSVEDALVFEDGTPARFWGTNITAYALFLTGRDNVRLQARRLSELGFNLVRVHHHDSYWVVPNIFGGEPSPDTKSLHGLALDRLDWWIKCLKDEGIYVWLDLHSQRALKPGDGIEAFAELSKGRPGIEVKGYNYINPSIAGAMQQFNDAYVNHFNPYTGLRYKDDPAIIAMLITNENDLTHHYGNGLLPNVNVPWHTARYMKEAEAFAARYGLPKDRIWRSWEHGPSKLLLNDLENRFNVEMIGKLRALNVKVPLVTTNSWGGTPLSSLPALTVGDMIDVHSYGGIGELEKNPIYAANLSHWIAAAQVANKPLSVTEWNVSPFPTADRHAIPLYIAGSARLQGWDALMQYAYAQGPINDRGVPSNWQAFNDPALLATMPAAALLYRRQDVREADTTYVFAPTQRQLFERLISPTNSVALRTAAERGKLLIAMPATRELPWLTASRTPEGAIVLADPGEPLLDPGASEVTSDTGELRRNWEKGTFTIDTPRTQAAMGWIGGQSIRLADIELEINTRNATVAVQSLDDKPLREASALLISLGARSVPSEGSQLPFRSEPVMGALAIRAKEGLKLYKKTGAGREEREVPTSYQGGHYRITLDRSLATYWLVLK